MNLRDVVELKEKVEKNKTLLGEKKGQYKELGRVVKLDFEVSTMNEGKTLLEELNAEIKALEDSQAIKIQELEKACQSLS